jgi:hypothetical protein
LVKKKEFFYIEVLSLYFIIYFIFNFSLIFKLSLIKIFQGSVKILYINLSQYSSLSKSSEVEIIAYFILFQKKVEFINSAKSSLFISQIKKMSRIDFVGLINLSFNASFIIINSNKFCCLKYSLSFGIGLYVFKKIFIKSSSSSNLGFK